MGSIGFNDDTLKIKFLLSCITREGNFPSLEKRGRGDFMDNMCLHVWTS